MFKRSSRLFTVLLVMLSILIGAMAAFAADAATPAASPAPAALAAFLRDTVFPIVGTFVLGVLSVFINRLGQKLHIESLTQKGNYLEKLAYQGITLAEERAAQYVGSKSSLTGKDKLDIAVGHVLAVMPKVSEASAQRLVESLLAQIPGLGATKDQSYSRGAIPGAFVLSDTATTIEP